jgi:hypothetical protein
MGNPDDLIFESNITLCQRKSLHPAIDSFYTLFSGFTLTHPGLHNRVEAGDEWTDWEKS